MENLSLEIWKEVEGFEGRYLVSNFGRVKTVAKQVSCHKKYFRGQKEIILKQSTISTGYAGFSLSLNGKRSYVSGHRLVAIAFLENPLKKEQVNHKDGDKLNNHVDNLEWNTVSENALHALYVLNRKTRLGQIGQRGINHSASIKINQFDLSGNLIKTWDCMNDAKRAGFGIGNIFSCCIGKRNTHKGFIWKYENTEP